MSQQDRNNITIKMANVLSHSSSDRVDTILDEMIELRRKECEECQSNKVLCILQPKCGPNRDFLDILIGIDYKDIPKFCYSQRIRETKRRLDAGEEMPSGTKIYLSDYLVLNGLKRRRTVTLEELESIEGFIAGTDLGDSLVVLIENNLIVVDVKAGTVTFNPWDFQVSRKNFEPFARLLIKRYDFLELHRLVEEYTGLWILEVKTRIPQAEGTNLDEAVKKSYHLLAYELEEPDLLRLIAEIQLTRRKGASILESQRYEPTIAMGNLRDAIDEVATVARNLQVIQVPSE